MILSDSIYKEYINRINADDIENAKDVLLSNVSSQDLIYRYSKGNVQVFNTLEKQELWLRNATTLNDPYDCAFIVNKMSKTRYDDNELDLARKEHESQRIQDIKSIEKRNAVYIACFSENYKSNSMWGYYGNNHKGLCVGYSLRNLIEKYDCMPVIYTDEFPSPGNENLRACVLTKSNTWQHELEWRIIKNEKRSFVGSGILIPFEHPRVIYIGKMQRYSYSDDEDLRIEIKALSLMKTDDKAKSQIEKLIDEKKGNLCVSLGSVMDYARQNRIRLYEFKINHKSFSMTETLIQ